MLVLAIDPGCAESAYVLTDEEKKPLRFGKVENEDMLAVITGARFEFPNVRIEVVIEMVSGYGMPVGREVFETCVWIGRFFQLAGDAELVLRSDVKLHVCGRRSAKDGNVRLALIDGFAKHDFKTGKGTKKNPDWFYGFRADVWQAYALAVTYVDQNGERRKNGGENE
jgi:hypothetical protein